MVFKSNADYYKFFANESLRGGSPLYERLSFGIAEDVEIQNLAAKRKNGQPPANLIFGAVQYLLLNGAQDPLGEYYPSLGGTRAVDDEAYGRFRAFCRKHEAELIEIIAHRVTNTNEVGRSALLAPGFEVVSRLENKPLGLIEIGSSAGLNLNFDRYGYRYRDEAGQSRLERWLDADFILECTLKGPGVPQLRDRPPAVGSRIGLELQPIDITQEKERLWLKALVWPERKDRFARLEGALKVAVRHPPEVKGGDAVLNLAEALAAVPADQVCCVYHTVMAYQLSREQVTRIHDTMLAVSRKRPVYRVTVEGEVVPPNPVATHNPLKVVRYLDGKLALRSLGVCDPHGTWIEWQAA